MLLFTAAAWASAEPLDLSPAEKAWVAAHPVLRLGVASEYPPYYFVPPAPARPRGFIIEMIDLWAERVGLTVEISRFASNAEALAALQARQIDMLPFALPAALSAGGKVIALPVISSNQVLVARRDLPDISATDNFGRYRVAVVADSPAQAMLAERFPQAKVVAFDSAEQALRAVASGAAELFVGYQQVVVYQVEKLLLANLMIRRNLGPGKLPIGPAVHQDATQLRELLARASGSVTAADRSALVSRWLPAGAMSDSPAELAALTPAEQEWVKQSGRIRIGFDADFSPITRQGDLGEPEGLAIDMLRLVARKTGLTVTREVGSSFADVYGQGRAGDLDVVVGIVRTPSRRADYDFVGPFTRIPTAIVMRSDDPYLLTDTSEFDLRKVALLRQHFLIPELMARHPDLQLVELDRQDQVLSAVAEGAADVALGNVKVVNELIERRFAGRLRITGTVFQGDSELYFGVRRGQPELTQILRKGLDAVSDTELSAIQQRWLLVNVQAGVPWLKILLWGGPLLVALLVGMAFLWRSNRQMAAAQVVEARGRRLAEEAVASRGRFLAYLSHELRGTLGAVASGAELIKSNQDEKLHDRMLDAISESMRGLAQVLETTLAFEQTLVKPIQLQLEPVKLRELWVQMLAPARLAAQQKGLAFDEICDTGDDTVQIDAPRLQQVVGNLLQNAVKFTAQGQVRIVGRWLRPGEALLPRLEISITDTGPGLSPDDLERIFEPYAQGPEGERQRRGAGLGLAISRQIVTAMQGTLEARSVLGSGATFTLRIPVHAVEAAA